MNFKLSNKMFMIWLVMKKITYLEAILITIIILFSLLTIGCEEPENITITSTSDGNNVKFCVSQYRNCIRSSSRGSSIFVFEVDSNGNFTRMMWDIERVERDKVGFVIYGHVPEGYREIQKPLPLELYKIYSLSFLRFFIVQKSDSKIICNMFDTFSEAKQFLDRLIPPNEDKKQENYPGAPPIVERYNFSPTTRVALSEKAAVVK